MVFHRFHSGIVAHDSWFGGNRLVVRGKGTRGSREIDTWFGGDYSWFGGSRARGLREITRGSREAAAENSCKSRGRWSGFGVPCCLKDCCSCLLTTTER